MIPLMSKECLKAFLSKVSVKDLTSIHISKVSSNFQKQFEIEEKQKRLLATEVQLHS